MARKLSLLRYLSNLTPGKVALWCYLIWYLVTVTRHFDPSPRVWLSSLGISAVVGVALLLSAGSERSAPLSRWHVFRLFLMPFCVSSFSALIKGQDYIFIPPSQPLELFISIGLCSAFVLLILGVKRLVASPAHVSSTQ